MNTKPYWLAESPPAKFHPLNRAIKVNVAVIGGGITGVTAAHLLSRAGCTVALLERDQCGQADTAHTTAHLTYVTDARLHELVRTFGRDHAQAAWDAGRAALQLIGDVVRQEEIDCEFAAVPGYLHAPRRDTQGQDESTDLENEAGLARELGFDAMFMESVPLLGRPGIRFGNQAKFHPLKYLNGLLATLVAEGVRVFDHSEVVEFSKDPHGVKANGQWVHCDYVVIATHVPLLGENNLLSGALFQSKITGYTTYAVGAKVPPGMYPQACFWDTGTPYDFLRVDHHADYDYAIFGGEDHKTGQVQDTPQRFDRLRQRFLSLLPHAQIDHHWSGQIIESSDGLPFIGEIADRQFVATGFCGNGITFGTLGAMLACDAALRRKNPWADLFHVQRKTLGSAWDYLKENIDYPYYMIKDRLATAEELPVDELPRGAGKLLQINGQRAACYRDDRGHVSAVSPVCTHLGCLVHWNAADATWDCPCHGSRFKPNGEVVAGPAETPLIKVNVTQKSAHAAAPGT